MELKTSWGSYECLMEIQEGWIEAFLLFTCLPEGMLDVRKLRTCLISFGLICILGGELRVNPSTAAEIHQSVTILRRCGKSARVDLLAYLVYGLF